MTPAGIPPIRPRWWRCGPGGYGPVRRSGSRRAARPPVVTGHDPPWAGHVVSAEPYICCATAKRSPTRMWRCCSRRTNPGRGRRSVPPSAAPRRRRSCRMRGLAGKAVLVAGGAGGIGTATSLRLGSEAARVAVADLDRDAAGAVAARIRSSASRSARRTPPPRAGSTPWSATWPPSGGRRGCGPTPSPPGWC